MRHVWFIDGWNLQILIVYKTEQSEYKEQEKRKCMCNITKRVVRWGMGKKLNPKHEPAQKLRNMSWLQALITLKRQRKTTKNWYFFKNLRDPHEMPCQKTVFQLKREQVWLPYLSYTGNSTKNKKNGRSCVISPKWWFGERKKNWTLQSQNMISSKELKFVVATSINQSCEMEKKHHEMEI